ncbi:GreA/GreB family elongation factor [Candidatus Dojkabacteria bacterium]|uniref:GreA/GreB family elongation factor n=1 Tax=Candidatus Dojkabacteria bacterium TaxID=2099670 RepID=A0A955L546_9BACT|nr:GreA/GreB family elongation factor [Candidatus Dojkabacteria bacterium]
MYTIKFKNLKKRIELVDEKSADPRNGKISKASPLGRAINSTNGKGDFKINTPIGEFAFSLI